jgi:hypothetical protein
MEVNPYESSRVEIAGTQRRCAGSIWLALGSLIVGLVAQGLFLAALERFVKPQVLGEFAGPVFIASVMLVFALASVVMFILGSKG